MHVQQIIRESAAGISASNPRRDEHRPVDPNAAITRTLIAAAEELASVAQALEDEIRDRTLTDHRWAAAVEQEEASRHSALHDTLTGLPNRVLFNDRLEHGIAHATRHRWILAVMFVDLDDFKSVNDTYGHQAGDAVLQIVGKRLAQNTRQEDTVSRYGGDEFLVLLTPLHDRTDIATIAGKIRKAIKAPCSIRIGEASVTLHLEASIGIAVLPAGGATASELIRSADAAMYGAKQTKSGFAFSH